MNTLMENMITLEVIIKLVIAATLSLVIGIERELKKKPVGLKTSLVIATFSCLLTIISIETAYSTPARDDINITMDPLRLAAQVVSGIGFLGAGVILRRGNDSISGLTTAAMIWGAAGIGIAVGAGFYMDAAIAVVIIVFGIEVLSPFLMKIGPKRIRMREISLKVQVDDDSKMEALLQFLTESNIIIENMRIKDIPLKNDTVLHELDLRLSLLVSDNLLSFYRSLRSLSYIEKIEMEILN
ncbi:protein sapB [Lysinibacillus contaminans]|uniref:Protein sapB n=1 Tax=Lysinibacillus contaminans TaxID=1293441 RepID=A0ABR5K7K6_9BACI|nr:MgtC/SapB family protein [Lysinibacillus contaminans]KOS71804.1 protein sapB [Lysinibacillus contaminans]